MSYCNIFFLRSQWVLKLTREFTGCQEAGGTFVTLFIILVLAYVYISNSLCIKILEDYTGGSQGFLISTILYLSRYINITTRSHGPPGHAKVIHRLSTSTPKLSTGYPQGQALGLSTGYPQDTHRLSTGGVTHRLSTGVIM